MNINSISKILKIDKNLVKEKIFETLNSSDILPKSKVWNKNIEGKRDKKLYWFLPKEIIEGNTINFITKEVDTGLGHRLFFLKQGLFINKLFNNTFTIVLEEKHWPERKLLNFPDSVIFTSNYSNINAVNISKEKFLDIFLLKNFDYINESTFSFKFDHFYDINLIYLEFLYRVIFKSKYAPNVEWDNFYLNVDPKLEIREEISTIKFISDDANAFLKKKFLNCIGLYVRRTNVPMTLENINTLPENIRDDFFKDYGFNIKRYESYVGPPPINTQFIPDEIHFAKIEKILKNNPKQKIYLCCDVNTKYVQHYKDKYPKNIIIRDDILPEFIKCFSENQVEKNQYMITYLMDLFALANCSDGIIYEFEGSHWIRFAEDFSWANLPSKDSHLLDWNNYMKNFNLDK